MSESMLQNNPSELDSSEQDLRQELSQLWHELRRVSDGLERSPSHDLEQRVKQLSDNIRLCKRDLKHILNQLAQQANVQASDE